MRVSRAAQAQPQQREERSTRGWKHINQGCQCVHLSDTECSNVLRSSWLVTAFLFVVGGSMFSCWGHSYYAKLG